MPQVVLFRRTNGAVGQEHVCALRGEPLDGVIGVDPRIHALGHLELGARRSQLGSDDGRSAAKAREKRQGQLRIEYSRTMPSLTFLGAAGTVTGSKHLLDLGQHRVLVDCGLFQGLKELRNRNWDPFPIQPSSIDAIVLTHAHLDHCGYLPRLVSLGFRGRVFCTPATKDLCSLVLPDSAHIQEEDAREANRHGFTRHQPALPLYTSADAARALDRLQPVGYERPVPLWVPDTGQAGVGPESGTGLAPTVEFINAGHLLGSAYARIRIGDHTILFGGDLGRYGRPVLPDPSPVAEADVLLLE